MKNKLRAILLLVVSAVVVSSAAQLRPVKAAEEGLFKAMKVKIEDPNEDTTQAYQVAEKKLHNALTEAVGATMSWFNPAIALSAPTVTASVVKGAISAIRDPSIGYNIQVTNLTFEPGIVFLTAELAINPLSTNTVFGELHIELIDTNGDGTAFMIGRVGDTEAIQGVGVLDTSANTKTGIGPPLGTSLMSPGIYSFPLDPFPGPTPPNGVLLSMSVAFDLSSGDTAHLTSRFIIDEGTGIPFAEIPDLPDPADGPYFNVIDVNSPETSLGDDWFIGSQTQLNLSTGGSIGERFNFHAVMNNELNDNNFDVEVNITGGTVGHQFMALGGTTVNISGGTIEGPSFLAGSYTGQSTDVEVNMSGGTMRARLLAYAGSVTNISGGVVGGVSADNGVVYLSGGTIGQQVSGNSLQTSANGVFHISGGTFGATGQISLLDEGVGNISGGSFTTAAQRIQAQEDTTINLFGREFLVDGLAIAGLEYGVPQVITDRDVTLSGLLVDGSPFSIDLNSADPSPAQGDWIHPDAMLTITLTLPGDYNNDGTVDAADYASWRNNLRSENVLPNDTSPGMVTEHDYELWRANFGQTAVSGATLPSAEPLAPAVPEPTTIAMILFGCLLVLPRQPASCRKLIRP